VMNGTTCQIIVLNRVGSEYSFGRGKGKKGKKRKKRGKKGEKCVTAMLFARFITVSISITRGKKKKGGNDGGERKKKGGNVKVTSTC